VKIAFLSLWILLGAVPAFADRGGIPNGGVGQDRGIGNQYKGAPAPLIGFGLPAVLGVGGVLLGAKLLRRGWPFKE
jgi:hypothetical protein